MGVAVVMMGVVMGVRVGHGKTLYYNITEVHAVVGFFPGHRRVEDRHSPCMCLVSDDWLDGIGIDRGGSLSRGCSGLLQLSQSVPHDGHRALQRKHSHNRGNDRVRPTGAGAEHAKRSQ
jgi:hypothetical protein